MNTPPTHRTRIRVTPVQWFAVMTGAFAALGAFIEAGSTPRGWSVFVQSALGVSCAVFAYQHRRIGGWFGVAWGIAQAVVIKSDGFEWIGRQVLATYVGTSESNPLLANGNVIALNAIGGFFACAWGWFLLREHWRISQAKA